MFFLEGILVFLKILTLKLLKDNYSYIILHPDSSSIVVIDPSDSKEILNLISEKNLKINAILNTHHHFDHTAGNLELKKISNCEVFASYLSKDKIKGFSKGLSAKADMSLDRYKIEVLETPGHTLDALSYYIPQVNALFTGDTLFSLGCGRIFEGSAELMWKSLKKIMSLPDDTLVYPGHEYTLNNLLFALSLEPDNIDLQNYHKKVKNLLKKNRPSIPSFLGDEKKLNPFLRVEDKNFIKKIFGSFKDPVESFRELRKLKDSF